MDGIEIGEPGKSDSNVTSHRRSHYKGIDDAIGALPRLAPLHPLEPIVGEGLSWTALVEHAIAQRPSHSRSAVLMPPLHPESKALWEFHKVNSD
ncbi:uncharacterized [Tachysurus ichikawai]